MDDEISVTLLHPSGALQLSTMHNGFRVSRRYYGYTEAQAVTDFKNQLNTNHDA